MSRPLRIQFPGAVYHIFTRGNAKQDIFRTDEDRYAFQKKLGEVVKVYDWICHTSCLMGNHYHLLVETLKGNLSLGMQSLNSDYAMGFHDRNGTDGHLFKGRFESRLIEKEAYLLEVMRYIVNNPVQAGLVEHPKDWKWSSYRAIAGIEDAPEFLMSDWVLGQFANDRKVAQALYQKFVEEGIGRES
ncbi:MAG: transposase, partial [Planctomycetota bacterium]|nr:transposase [Planctomycetota bacterium]